MRAIMVPVANRPECAIALNSAFKLAKNLGADVHGVHIRAHRNSKTRLPAGRSILQFMSEHSPWDEVSEADATSQGLAAHVFFQELAHAHGFDIARKPRQDQSPVALWSEKVGAVEFIMPIIGPMCDMMVVSRPLKGKTGGHKALVFLSQALLNSQRPILVLPQKKTPELSGHIAIAWNKSAEASRALHAALPLLISAEKISFLTIGHQSRLGPSADEMAHYLRHYGIRAEHHTDLKENNAGDGLLRLYREIGANLLVMGAYSRPRLTEFVFGGATRQMLQETDIPVFMYHS